MMGFKREAVQALVAAVALFLCAAPSATNGFVVKPFARRANIAAVNSVVPLPTTTTTTPWALYGKKDKRKGGGGGGSKGGGGGGQMPQQEKQSVKDARFDAATRQFMFTLVGLTKTLPDKSKQILKNIHLSFYPGAKIGVVGLNGSGTSLYVDFLCSHTYHA